MASLIYFLTLIAATNYLFNPLMLISNSTDVFSYDEFTCCFNKSVNFVLVKCMIEFNGCMDRIWTILVHIVWNGKIIDIKILWIYNFIIYVILVIQFQTMLI